MKILETSLYAEDLEAVERFYTEVLGLAVFLKDPSRHVFFKLDAGMLLIFKASHTAHPAADELMLAHGAVGPGHVCFTAADLDALDRWRERLTAAGVVITREITWRPGVQSIYFTDPAGNILEFATPTLWGFDA